MLFLKYFVLKNVFMQIVSLILGWNDLDMFSHNYKDKIKEDTKIFKKNKNKETPGD